VILHVTLAIIARVFLFIKNSLLKLHSSSKFYYLIKIRSDEMKKVVSKLVFFMSLGFLLITACSFSVLAAEEAEYGGTLNYPLPYPQSISTLEPGQSNDVTQSIVTKAIFLPWSE
jgi:hypothetical protein